MKSCRLLAVLLVPWACVTASAQDQREPFYNNKDIKIIVPTGPGGGWATSALILSRHLRRFIPGNPTVVPQFMPGAGGTVAANYLAQVAPRDGTTLGIPLKEIAQTQVTQLGVRYKSNEFVWIGRIAPVRTVMFVWHKAPAITIEAIRKTEVLAGSLSMSDQGYMMPTFMNHLTGTKFRVVSGFKGGSEMFLAMERGEIHGWAGAWDATVASKGDWIRDGRLIPIMQFSLSKTNVLTNVPLLMDFSKSDDDKRMVEFLVAGSEVGRSLMAPPGVPEDRISVLRKAFAAAMEDKQVIAEFAKVHTEIEPLAGEQVASQIERIVSTPSAVLARLSTIFKHN